MKMRTVRFGQSVDSVCEAFACVPHVLKSAEENQASIPMYKMNHLPLHDTGVNELILLVLWKGLFVRKEERLRGG